MLSSLIFCVSVFILSLQAPSDNSSNSWGAELPAPTAALESWLAAVESRDMLLDQGIEFKGKAIVTDYLRPEGGDPILRDELGREYLVYHSARQHLHEANDRESCHIEWCMYTEGVGASTLVGNASLPLAMEYRIGEKPYQSDAHSFDPIFFGLWSINGRFPDLFESSKLVSCEWIEFLERPCLSVVLSGPAHNQSLAKGAWELTIDATDSLLVLKSARYKTPRSYDSGRRDEIVVDNQRLEKLLEWVVVEFEEINGVALPVKGIRTSGMGDQYNPGTDLSTRIIVSIDEILVGSKELPDYLRPPMGVLTFDDDLARWVEAPTAENNLRGVSLRQLEFYEFLVDPSLSAGDEFLPQDFEKALESLRMGYELNCGVLAGHLFARAIGGRSDIEDSIEAISIDEDGFSSLQDLREGIESYGLAVEALELNRTSVEELETPALVHLPGRGPKRGHFAVICPAPDGVLNLVDPPLRPEPFDWDFSIGSENGSVSVILAKGVIDTGAHWPWIALFGGLILLSIVFLVLGVRKLGKARHVPNLVLLFGLLSVSCPSCSPSNEASGSQQGLHAAHKSSETILRLVDQGIGQVNVEGLIVGEKREISVIVENTTSKPFTVADIDVSCTCTEATLTEREIQPGGRINLGLTLDVDRPNFQARVHLFGHSGGDAQLKSGVAFNIGGRAECDRMVVRPSQLKVPWEGKRDLTIQGIWSSGRLMPPDPEAIQILPEVDWLYLEATELGATEQVHDAWLQTYSIELLFGSNLPKPSEGLHEFEILGGEGVQPARLSIMIVPSESLEPVKIFVGSVRRDDGGVIHVPLARIEAHYPGLLTSIRMAFSEEQGSDLNSQLLIRGDELLLMGIEKNGPFTFDLVQCFEALGQPMQGDQVLVGVVKTD